MTHRSRAPLWANSLCSAALALGLLAPLSASAATLDSQWPSDVEAALVVARPDVLADLLDAFDARYGDVPEVRALVTRLRETEVAGVRPATRRWGAGLALERGAALFKTKAGVRLVVGAQEAAAAEFTLRGLGALAPLDAEGAPARCAGSDSFLVCESGTVSGRGGPPSGVTSPDGAIAWAWGSGEAVAALAPSGVALKQARAQLAQVGDRVTLSADADFELPSGAPAAPLSPARLWSLATPRRAEGRPSLVTPGAPAALKLDFDLPGALGLARGFGALPPPVTETAARLEGSLTGEVTLTFDGSMLHPVLLLGVAPGAAGDVALPALVGAFALTGARASAAACADAPALTCVDLGFGSGGGAEGEALFGVRVHLRAVRVGDTLVLATTAPDAARRLAPGFVSAPLPGALGAAGASGLTMPGFAAFAGIMGAKPFFQVTGEFQRFVDWQTLAGLVGAMVEGFDLVIWPTERRLAVELGWRTM